MEINRINITTGNRLIQRLLLVPVTCFLNLSKIKYRHMPIKEQNRKFEQFRHDQVTNADFKLHHTTILTLLGCWVHTYMSDLGVRFKILILLLSEC